MNILEVFEFMNGKKLFLVGGASGTGKTAICNQIAGKISGLVVLDGDVIWSCGNFMPDKTEVFYSFVLRLCNEITKSGLSVAVFHAGAGVPGNIENCPERKLFDEVHYLGLYCSDEELEKRLRMRPEWQSQNPDGFINAMKGFNAMYRFYGEDRPKMDKIDTSEISLEESSRQVVDWISQYLY